MEAVMIKQERTMFSKYEDREWLDEGLRWFGEVLADAGISLDDPRLVFSTRKDGLCPIPMNQWWVFTPFFNYGVGLLVDEEAVIEFESIANPDRVSVCEYGKNVGYWILFEIEYFEHIPAFVREGMVRALRDLDARNFKGSMHKRYDKLGYRNAVKALFPALAA